MLTAKAVSGRKAGRPALQLVIAPGSLLLEEVKTGFSDTNRRTAMDKSDHHQSPIGRILPHRKLRTRRAPCLHRFMVSTFSPPHPLYEIEDQILNGISHRRQSLTPNPVNLEQALSLLFVCEFVFPQQW